VLAARVDCVSSCLGDVTLPFTSRGGGVLLRAEQSALWICASDFWLLPSLLNGSGGLKAFSRVRI
jgi:hypothetical protein